jgi:CRP-like cAMP-binding protein
MTPWRIDAVPTSTGVLIGQLRDRAMTVSSGWVPFGTMGALVAIEERKKLLSEVWLFHGATDEELTRLAELAYEVRLGPHVDIVTEDEFGDELFLVVDGHATVTREGVDLGVLNAGDFFGEMALLGTGVRASTVRSIVAMTLLGLRAEHVDDLLASDPTIARRVLSVVVQRLDATDRRLAELEGRRRSG